MAEKKAKEEREKVYAERDDLIKQKTKMESKEMQHKHELRSKDIQIRKLQETLQKKQASGDKGRAGLVQTGAEFLGPSKANPDTKFSKVSGETDFHLMITSENANRANEMRRENQELRECLVMLQKELMEVVTLKQDIFS